MTSMADKPPSSLDFQPLSQSFAQNPYPWYAKLREIDTLHFFTDFDVYLVSRFDDVARVVKDQSMVRSMYGLFPDEEIEAQMRCENWHDMPYYARYIKKTLLDSDGPDHDRLRKQVFMLFTPASIERLRVSIQEYVDGLIAEIGSGELDFIEDFAASIPGHVIGQLLGVPAHDRQMLRQWSEDIVQYFDIDRTEERKELAESTTKSFCEYLMELKLAKANCPGDDLLSKLLEAESAGMLDEDEFLSTCMLILMAGHGSTLDVMGTGLLNLLRFPDQLQRLKADPGLVNTAVQEMFRFDSPLPFFHRYNVVDVEINGVRFSRGTKFGLLHGAANRDPGKFAKPDVFDVARKPNRHIAFGGGAHFCLGNHLSRLNMDILFTTMLQQYSTIELVEDQPQFKRGLSVRGLTNLNIELQRA